MIIDFLRGTSRFKICMVPSLFLEKAYYAHKLLCLPAWLGLSLTSYIFPTSPHRLCFPLFTFAVCSGGGWWTASGLAVLSLTEPSSLCASGSGSEGSSRSGSSNARGHAAAPGAVSLRDLPQPALRRVRPRCSPRPSSTRCVQLLLLKAKMFLIALLLIFLSFWHH